MDRNNKDWQDELLSSLKNLIVSASFDQHWYPLRTIEAHSHPYYQLDYFYGGHGQIAIGASIYDVNKGDLFVLNPGDVHHYRASQEKPMENITLKFGMTPQDNRIVFPNYLGNLGLMARSQQLELENYMRRACAEVNKTAADSAQLASAISTVFFVLLVRYLRDLDLLNPLVSNMSHNEVVMEYIRRHYDRHITLEDLSKITKLHPKYLCHKFSAELGISPMAALTVERIKTAKKLLMNTTLSVAEIGLRVGYTDVYHFSKRFKEVVGMPPSDFRKAESVAFHEME